MSAQLGKPWLAERIPERTLEEWLARGWEIQDLDTALTPCCLELRGKMLRIVWAHGCWTTQRFYGGRWQDDSAGPNRCHGRYWVRAVDAVWACEHDGESAV